MLSTIAISSCSQPIGQALYGILFEKLYAMPWTVMVGGAIVAFCISIFLKGIFYRLEKEDKQYTNMTNLKFRFIRIRRSCPVWTDQKNTKYPLWSEKNHIILVDIRVQR